LPDEADMGRDRLAEFRQKAHITDNDDRADSLNRRNMAGNGVSYTATDGAVAVQIEDQQGSREMQTFFNEVDGVRRLIEELREDVKSVIKHHSDILSTPNPEEKKRKELDTLMSTIQTSSKVIRAKLKDMEKGIKSEEDKMKPDEDGVPAICRIRRSQHSALLRDFVDVMNGYQKAQVEYRDRCKTRIKRQLHIAETELTDDQIETMVDKGNFSVFTGSILAHTEQAKQMLADVTARHDDIIKLEKSLRELHDLFLEMAILIENQGEIVDRIETQVTNTRDWVEKGRENLRQAETMQTKARKKKIWIIIILTVIALVLGLIIWLSLP